MGVAVDMLLHSLTAKSRLKGEKFVQFNSVRKVRGTFMLAWESSPTELEERDTLVVGTGRLFLRGLENRMGYTCQSNQLLSVGVIPLILSMVKEEMEDNDKRVAAKLVKFGVAITLATCGSL